jgi:hypothetical protein
MLSDEQQIANIINSVAECRDRGDFEGVARIFERGTYRTEYVPYQGRPGRLGDHAVLVGYDGILEAYNRLVRKYDGNPLTKHVTANMIIELDDDETHALVKSYYLLVQSGDGFGPMIISAGRYHDKLEKMDGKWWLVERLCISDQVGDQSHHLLMQPEDYGNELREKQGTG